MSLRILSRVWEHSQARKTDLLVLLALADAARDCGFAWPGVAVLAAKARVSEREVQYAIKRLVELGELARKPSSGRYLPNLYCVLLERPADDTEGCTACTPTWCNPCTPQGCRACRRETQAAALRAAKRAGSGVKAGAPHPLTASVEAPEKESDASVPTTQGPSLSSSAPANNNGHIDQGHGAAGAGETTDGNLQGKGPAEVSGEDAELLAIGFPFGENREPRAWLLNALAQARRNGASQEDLAEALRHPKGLTPWKAVRLAGEKAHLLRSRRLAADARSTGSVPSESAFDRQAREDEAKVEEAVREIGRRGWTHARSLSSGDVGEITLAAGSTLCVRLSTGIQRGCVQRLLSPVDWAFGGAELLAAAAPQAEAVTA